MVLQCPLGAVHYSRIVENHHPLSVEDFDATGNLADDRLPGHDLCERELTDPSLDGDFPIVFEIVNREGHVAPRLIR